MPKENIKQIIFLINGASQNKCFLISEQTQMTLHIIIEFDVYVSTLQTPQSSMGKSEASKGVKI